MQWGNASPGWVSNPISIIDTARKQWWENVNSMVLEEGSSGSLWRTPELSVHRQNCLGHLEITTFPGPHQFWLRDKLESHGWDVITESESRWEGWQAVEDAVRYEKLIFDSPGFKKVFLERTARRIPYYSTKFHFYPKSYWEQFPEQANRTFFTLQCRFDE